ncbi:MAG TPA: transcription elongation factor GreA [bacterium]|nr:transcription elongation factor GreA [bacterium]
MSKNKNTVYLTQDGLEKLKSELSQLLQEKRPAVAQRIKEAREMGDISENAEYDAAQQEQAFVEGRISELEELIKNAEVINEEAGTGEVRIGSKVTVKIDGGEETFYIVGAQEADPLENKISHESPLGASLVGKKVGDSFEVEAPIGMLTYKIVKIS